MWSKEQAAHIEALHPLDLGKPEDIANAIAFLLANTARSITIRLNRSLDSNL
jgi:hypothetical protein